MLQGAVTCKVPVAKNAAGIIVHGWAVGLSTLYAVRADSVQRSYPKTTWLKQSCEYLYTRTAAVDCDPTVQRAHIHIYRGAIWPLDLDFPSRSTFDSTQSTAILYEYKTHFLSYLTSGLGSESRKPKAALQAIKLWHIHTRAPWVLAVVSGK